MILYIIFGFLVAALIITIGSYLFLKFLLPDYLNDDLFKLHDPEYFEAKRKKLFPEKPQIKSSDIDAG